MTAQGLRELVEGDPLTLRDLQVLDGAAKGESAIETGIRLFLAADTIRDYRKKAIAKLGARNITNAVAIAIKCDLI